MSTPDPLNPTPLPASHDGGRSGNALPVGHTLHEFEITGLVGEGGFGIVYLARDTQLHRTVAIKEYMPASLAARAPDLSVTVRSERQRETFSLGMRSFVNEARILASFDHPALIKVYRFWEANGTAYMVMPYYQGPTLKSWLREQTQSPDEAWLKAMLAPLLDALEVIHADHCYHRDIAPDNILLLGPDKPLLLDFGAARRVIGDATQALTVILKPGYAPVEQYAEMPSMKQGPWTDIYALCAVLYAVIIGKAPPPSVGRMMKDEMTPLVHAAAGRYSQPFLAAIDAGLTVHPEQRPRDIAALRARLFATELPADTVIPPAPAEGDDEHTQIIPPGATPATLVSEAWQKTHMVTAVTGVPPAPLAESAVAHAPPAPATAPATAPRTAAAHAGGSGEYAGFGPATIAAGQTVTSTPAFADSAQVPASPGDAGDAGQAGVAKRDKRVLALSALGLVGLLVGGGAWWLTHGSTAGADTVASQPALEPAVTASASSTNAGEGASAPVAGNDALAGATSAAPTTMPATRNPFTIVGALEDIVRNADPLMAVNTITDKSRLVIGRDKLLFQVKSSVPGYIYVYLAGTDQSHFYLLFPNALDRNNRIEADKLVELPRKGWHITAGGPPGVDHIVTLVSPTPRDLSQLGLNTKDSIPEFDIATATKMWAAHQGPGSPFVGSAICGSGGNAAAGALPCDQHYGASFVHIEEVSR